MDSSKIKQEWLANDKEFDIIVIGSRGLNTLQEQVLGSVAIKWQNLQMLCNDCKVIII